MISVINVTDEHDANHALLILTTFHLHTKSFQVSSSSYQVTEHTIAKDMQKGMRRGG